MLVKRYEMKVTYNHFACEDQVVEVECSDGQYVKFSDYEQLQQRIAELAAQVEVLRSASQPIINDYFNWMEVNEVDVSELTESYQKVYDMMANLNCKLQSTPTQCLAEHDREVAARAVEYIAENVDFGSLCDAMFSVYVLKYYANKIKSGEVII